MVFRRTAQALQRCKNERKRSLLESGRRQSDAERRFKSATSACVSRGARACRHVSSEKINRRRARSRRRATRRRPRGTHASRCLLDVSLCAAWSGRGAEHLVDVLANARDRDPWFDFPHAGRRSRSRGSSAPPTPRRSSGRSTRSARGAASRGGTSATSSSPAASRASRRAYHYSVDGGRGAAAATTWIFGGPHSGAGPTWIFSGRVAVPGTPRAGKFAQNVYPYAYLLRDWGRGETALEDVALRASDGRATPAAAEELWTSWRPFWNASASLLVEKSPENCLRGPFLEKLFPRNARFVVVFRRADTRPRDVFSFAFPKSLLKHRRTSRPPRPKASTERPRRGRGRAATRFRGISTSRPRRRRDSPPRNVKD